LKPPIPPPSLSSSGRILQSHSSVGDVEASNCLERERLAMDVTVYGPLRSATGGKRVSVDFDGGTVRDAVDAFVDAYPRAERHLFDADGRLVPSVRLSVDGRAADPDEPCPADATLAVHPAMRGG
jgi:molybdopterin synthase sulfur carrier subunit